MQQLGLFPGGADTDAGDLHVDLLDPDGTALDVKVTGLGTKQDFLTVVTPTNPLLPHTRYTVDVVSSAFTDHEVTSFTTGDGPDTTAPPIPKAQHLGFALDGDGRRQPVRSHGLRDVHDRSDARAVLRRRHRW